MARFSQGAYYPRNPGKYRGTTVPHYRSSWERRVFQWCDTTPQVIAWQSEPFHIPYRHPITGRSTRYVPDLLIQYRDRAGIEHVELIEIKPSSQTFVESARTPADHAARQVNLSKWAQAALWCRSRGIKFRVITERDIFGLAK